ncbi:hypothetical protein AAHN97_20255 [Chitinophaga niabensis]|uniref:hypothetical protein n=1 Tax=Chitinophaga niabensis TaxID=536979 RepID=UPI0031BAD76D
MTRYNYFIQEGSKFHLKSKFSTALLRSLICLGIAAGLYFLLPPEKKIGAIGAGFFILFGLINLLRSTKKLTIDTAAQTIVHKNNVLSPEVTYRFDEFVQFYVLTSSYLFKAITMDSTAFLIFDQNGREKRVPVVVGLFSARPAQNAVNELSEIMGIELA